MMPIRELAAFSVPWVGVLDEHGEVDAELDPALDESQLLALYRAMSLAREADARMINLQRQGRLGTFPPSTGHEAAVCAPVLAMRPQDWYVGAYRDLGARLMRGESLADVLVYWNGFEEGAFFDATKRTLPIQVIIGAQLPHAVGIAYAMRYQGEAQTAVLAFCGDGATSEGDFHEALNFAAVWRVPVVFVVVNNGWAISVPRGKQTHSATIAQKAVAYGMPGVQVDGNDALAMYRVTSEALARARTGDGPSLIEAVTYRLLMHTTADDPRKYRDEEEERVAWSREPLRRLRLYLEHRGCWNASRQAALEAELRQEIGAAVEAFEAWPLPRPDAPFDMVFEVPPPELEVQRRAFLQRVGGKRASDA